MIASRSVHLAVMACAAVVLAACASSPPGVPDPGRSRTGRNDAPRLPAPKDAGSKACSQSQRNADATDREWERIDAEYEQRLRDIMNEGVAAQEALATLDKEVLKPHKWSLSRYLVSVIRELNSNSMRMAGVEIGNETYAEASLRDASWDGYSAWEIVRDVRGQTLQMFVWLEKTRTTDNPKARDAQSVGDGLMNAARTTEPWMINGGCRRPTRPPPERDPANLAPDDTGTRTGSTEGSEVPHPRGGLAARPCPLIGPVVAVLRGSKHEREWKRVEKTLEPTLREIVNEGITSREALASLENDVLKPHKWSLSRYLVRVIRELQSDSVHEASVEIGHEAYTEASLRDAHWDGYNAWDVVEGVRAETLEILLSLENARTSENPKAQDAQKVADGLMQVARTAEPWTTDGGCTQPNDPPPRTPATALPATARTS
jgi:hypothetical protein